MKIRFFMLVLSMALSASAWSETLQQAWAAAKEFDQHIAVFESERDAADHGVLSARASRYPRVDLIGSFTQLDSAPRFVFGDSFVSPKIFDDDNFVSAGVQMQLPIFTSGLIPHQISAAKSVADASQWQLEAITQSVLLDVARNYINVLRATSAVTVAHSSVATLTSHAEDASNQFKFGAVPKNDFLAASVSLANSRQQELQAVNQLDSARAAYNRSLGRPLTTRVVLDVILPADISVDEKNLEGLTQQALQNRQELKGLSAGVDALDNKSVVERARSRPQFALTSGYNFLENDVLDRDKFWSVGVTLKWNLFDGGQTRARAAASELNSIAMQRRMADLKSNIALQVRKAWLDCGESASRRSVAENAVEQAIENLQVARNRYAAGAGTNTEVLDAETLHAQTLNNRDNAGFDEAFARLRLTRAIGAL